MKSISSPHKVLKSFGKVQEGEAILQTLRNMKQVSDQASKVKENATNMDRKFFEDAAKNFDSTDSDDFVKGPFTFAQTQKSATKSSEPDRKHPPDRRSPPESTHASPARGADNIHEYNYCSVVCCTLCR